jgi:Family of unknown function (DUF5990)
MRCRRVMRYAIERLDPRLQRTLLERGPRRVPMDERTKNIHVGLARRSDTVELRPGDARLVRWSLDVTVKRDDDGQLDLGGPFVHGARGERSLGLRWGTLAEDDTFDVFRAGKLRLSDLDPALVQEGGETFDRGSSRGGGSTEVTATVRGATRGRRRHRPGGLRPAGLDRGSDGRASRPSLRWAPHFRPGLSPRSGKRQRSSTQRTRRA